MIYNITNYVNRKAFFKLHAMFSPTEFPLFARASYSLTAGTRIIAQRLNMQVNELLNEMPYHIYELSAELAPFSSLVLRIPYQQVHRNFETIGSDHLIQSVIQSSILEYRLDADSKTNTFYIPNVAYKTKNYDTTIVFAVIAIYVVCIYFFFGPVTNMRTSLPPIKDT